MNTLAAISSIVVAMAIKATLVLFLAWGGALLLRRLSAAARHMLLAFAVIAVLLLPFSAFLPQWPVRGLPYLASRLAPATQNTAATPAVSVQSAEPPQVTQAPVNAPAVLSRSFSKPSRVEARLHTSRNQVASTKQQEPIAALGTTQPIAPSIADNPAKTRHPLAWPLIWALVWILGSAYFCLRSMVGRSRVRALVRRALLLSGIRMCALRPQQWALRVMLRCL